ncbi:acylase [Parasphingopyxis algicola]|uniref:penicillin acylase family protein n=1 Tax=Parasphingopyxis algicola TaxID=2026624 RepID=UPI0015A1CCC0|nr:penicillin acylase family protein [Parasphingopyxis algicola]QLC24462.1 acylase [Parasphingopyxis algicola]
MKKLAKILGAIVAIMVVAAAANAVLNSQWYARQEQVAAPETDYDVVIRRDRWGVPHVLGQTDADAAFGLAYAHAEDDFATFQEVIASARGRLGELTGAEGAAQDYAWHLFDARSDVDDGYERELSPETRALIEAYADGLNLYASEHPEELRIRGLFPVTGEDIATGFAFTSPFFYGIDRTLGALAASEEPPRNAEPATERGSNAFAIAPSRDPDGATKLIVNSHQPWNGPVAWYEAHVTSAEGLDMIGGLFPIAPLPLLGHNRHISWTNTVNRPDLVDVYALTLNDAGDAYRFDGEWRPLESRRIWLHVRMGPLVVPIPRTVYRSIHGPVMINDNGAFAIRYAGIGEIRQVEQYYRLTRAESFEEWQDVMRMQAIPATNFIYADREGHIARLYNARFPDRAEGFDWRGVLPGDTSRALWTADAPFASIPFLADPDSGYIFDANSTPCIATAEADNLDCDGFSELLGVESNRTNRMLRADELLAAIEGPIGWPELRRVKYDTGYSRLSAAGPYFRRIAALNFEPGDLSDAQQLLARWDWTLDGEGSADGLAALVLRHIMLAAYRGDPLPDPRETFAGAVEFLMTEHGRLDVPLGAVVRLRRGAADLPLSGGPDALRAIYWGDPEDGAHSATAGDSYIMEITWHRDGTVSSRSVHQFGAASTRPDSRHYDDQAQLFAAMRMKDSWFDAEELAPNIVCSYRPGEQGRTPDGAPCPR